MKISKMLGNDVFSLWYLIKEFKEKLFQMKIDTQKIIKIWGENDFLI